MMDRANLSTTVPRRAPERSAARSAALLVVGNGSFLESLREGRMVVAGPGGLEIGRHPSADGDRAAVALADPTVSGRHAQISGTGAEGYFVEDLRSTNGTMVDGVPVTGRAALREGSVIFLGSQVAVFRTVTPADTAAIAAEQVAPFAPVATLSPRLAALCLKLRRLAPSGSEVILLGETGTGKEVFAHAIHTQSGRRGELVAVNCAALPRELVESELFGYESGAHSTARTRKAGLIEAAHGGTLFLDELGEMPMEAQSKLLRFVQDQTYLRVGGTRPVFADVRVVAASSRAAHDGGPLGIQEALLGRLGAEPIELPPLRDRLEDLGRLVAHFLAAAGRVRALAPEAFQALFFHDWPRNVRELQKVIGEAELLCDGDAIQYEHLPRRVVGAIEHVTRGTPPVPGDQAAKPSARARRSAPDVSELKLLMRQYRGNVTHVSRHLDRQWNVVWRWLQRHGIDPALYRGGQGSEGSEGSEDPEDPSR